MSEDQRGVSLILPALNGDIGAGIDADRLDVGVPLAGIDDQ